MAEAPRQENQDHRLDSRHRAGRARTAVGPGPSGEQAGKSHAQEAGEADLEKLSADDAVRVGVRHERPRGEESGEVGARRDRPAGASSGLAYL